MLVPPLDWELDCEPEPDPPPLPPDLLSELAFDPPPEPLELECFEEAADSVILATATAPPSERATRLISSWASDCSNVTSS